MPGRVQSLLYACYMQQLYAAVYASMAGNSKAVADWWQFVRAVVQPSGC